MFSSLTRKGKQIVDYPEDHVPTVTTRQWVRNLSPDPKQDALRYFKALFPIAGWIGRYNFGWLSGDVVAGLTVGIVLVPQSMSYAQIATLPSEYGLYSAFVGVFVYCFFATSKDVSIGPVAVMSLTVSQIIKSINASHPEHWAPQTIATTVSFLCGFIVLALGLLRIGWLVEFIPAPAVSGFMTGSAINIVSGQIPGLMGITGFDTRAATYKVIVNTLKGLPHTKMDAAFGLPALVTLYAIRIAFDRLAKRYPTRARTFFFISIMRNGVILVVLTIASFLYTRHHRSASGKYPIKILQNVPRGFQHIGAPILDGELISALAPQLPVATIILLLEHIAISKSFGRVNGYKINPDQELIAIGVTNTVGTLFNAYPSTGSFSRSALQSKCGVRTPLSGWFTGIVVVVALYGLTPAFFWIPTAGLSAIIIHAVADLVASPAHVYAFWRVSPLEFVIWLGAVATTIFATIEDGIYVSIVASLVLLLIRVARPRGHFLGRVTVHADEHQRESRDVYVPLKQSQAHAGTSLINPHVRVEPPKPGVVVYRYEESVLYPNCSIMNSALVDYVKAHTRRGRDMTTVRQSDRPWNDPGPKANQSAEDAAAEAAKPLLKAIVLDFSTVSHIDTTGVQALVDTRTEVERWADCHVEFHFANILSPWIRRALVAGGFGTGARSTAFPTEVAPVMYFNELGGGIDADNSSAIEVIVDAEAGMKRKDSKSSSAGSSPRSSRRNSFYGATADPRVKAAVVPQETPFFHLDLTAAVNAAEYQFNEVPEAETK